MKLTLADLRKFDPEPLERGRYLRFMCPSPNCKDKPVDNQHRSLSYDTVGGKWRCWRCSAWGVDASVGTKPVSQRVSNLQRLQEIFKV